MYIYIHKLFVILNNINHLYALWHGSKVGAMNKVGLVNKVGPGKKVFLCIYCIYIYIYYNIYQYVEVQYQICQVYIEY